MSFPRALISIYQHDRRTALSILYKGVRYGHGVAFPKDLRSQVIGHFKSLTLYWGDLFTWKTPIGLSGEWSSDGWAGCRQISNHLLS